jgi:autotransporter-associated beta strand protein
MSHHRKPARRGRRQERIVAAAALAALTLSRSAAADDQIGLGQLLSLEPSLVGTGVRVGEVESDESSTNTFEVDPSAVGQPDLPFTYTDDSGNVTTTFNPAEHSYHADGVAARIYGTSIGVAPGVSEVDVDQSDYFSATTIPDLIAIPDAVVNQDFSAAPSYPPAEDNALDTAYDNYVDTYGTIFVSGVGNDPGMAPEAPATYYNGIGVGAYTSGDYSNIGPTVDGRSKPDITVIGDLTSFTAPIVTGSAILLVQAGARGDGGSTAQVEAEAVDARTVKALLLNGADKQNVPFIRTPLAPLDPLTGAGNVNIYNSYLTLAAGLQGPNSVSDTVSVGAAHPAVTGTPMSVSTGWDFATLTTTASADQYANYIFQPGGTAPITMTATLVWERQFNGNTATTIGINTVDLYLYDCTAGRLLDWSTSAVDNVQDVYDTNLIPGDVYDLQVLKRGGVVGSPGVVSNAETYALAFSSTATTASVLTNSGVWNSSGGGSWGAASNWYNGAIPRNAEVNVNFSDAITGPATITLDGSRTAGNINFDNSNSYTIAAGSGGALNLDNHSAGEVVAVTNYGVNCICVPIFISCPMDLVVVGAPDALALSGNIGEAAGGMSLSLAGEGTAFLSGNNKYTGGTVLDGGTLAITSDAAVNYDPVYFDGGVLRLGNYDSYLFFNASTDAYLGATGTSTLSGIVGNSNSGTTSLSYFGPDTLTLAGSNTYGGSTTVNAGCLVIGAPGALPANTALAVGGAGTTATFRQAAGIGPITLSSLTINSGSTVDIGNNRLVVNYGLAANDPIESVAGYLRNGFGGGSWSGTSGIVSTLIGAGRGSPILSVGYVDGGTDNNTVAGEGQILIAYTLAGDANLDGRVNSADLLAVVQNFNKTGTDWSQGNFTYIGDGQSTTSPDLLLVIQNFNQSLAAPGGAAVGVGGTTSLAGQTANAQGNVPMPEPGVIGPAVGGLIVRRRRRRRRAGK